MAEAMTVDKVDFERTENYGSHMASSGNDSVLNAKIVVSSGKGKKIVEDSSDKEKIAALIRADEGVVLLDFKRRRMVDNQGVEEATIKKKRYNYHRDQVIGLKRVSGREEHEGQEIPVSVEFKHHHNQEQLKTIICEASSNKIVPYYLHLVNGFFVHP
ncbi:hypothetical protein K2173_014177 [Erythroxylum novogranatense]|uniref:Uncharacterized protein n=1 Tax=Erythroxylum novogranatense TaxID=1862640 RepID=A0AAV8SDH7_9ROSI|nr:hypothetical protein K2173_014177 [Erythroxylum novogranatense]